MGGAAARSCGVAETGATGAVSFTNCCTTVNQNYIDSVRTSQKIQRASFRKTTQIILYVGMLKSELFIVKIIWNTYGYLMFIGPCIIAIVEERKTNLMSLVILFHLLWAQRVSDINISIFRSLRLCGWITTSVVLFSVLCVLEHFLLRLIFGGVRFAGWSTQSQAPEDGYINVRNMLSA
jgi:hypothetical protein